MNKKLLLIFLCFLSGGFLLAQKDTNANHGTIKIKKAKAKKKSVYLYAEASFGKYNLTKKKYTVASTDIFQPFPVVPGHAYPFNYTGFFNEKFEEKIIDLGNKDNDTVTLEVTVLENGKVSIRDKSKVLYVKGVAVFYNQEADGYEINNLHLNCMDALKSIKEWLPAYYIVPTKDKFKNTVVIKPKKEKVDAQGIVKIYFSTSPFDY